MGPKSWLPLTRNRDCQSYDQINQVDANHAENQICDQFHVSVK